MHDVFISYSSKDLDITEQVRQILETMATRQKKRPLENLNYVLDNYMR